MRFLLISLLAVLLVNIVQAQDYFDTTDDYKEEFKGEKVTLGKKKCTCSFMLEVDGDKCSGKGGCDKKCSGSGSVEIGRYSFTLKVKKGKATISKCKAEVESTPLPTTGGSGSGEEPITMPPAPGSGSGSGPSPPMGEGMQCRCKCNCPDGSGECDCDCNCPMQSTAMTCASGFTRVCPMVEDACPEDMDMICPMNAASRMGGAEADGTVKGCQCVPDFLMSLVSPGMPPAAVRLGATSREAVEASIKVGKTQCKCSFDMAMDGLSCKKSKGRCDKKCNGAAKGVELMDGMYMLDMKVKKGKVTIAKCEVTPIALTGTGTGSGTGSGEGAGGMGGMGSRCACVGKGMGGSGPPPPTGSGSGPVPPTGGPVLPTGGPVLPTGGPVLPTGGPVLPTEGPVPPTGTGSGSGPVVTAAPSPSGSTIANPGGAATELTLSISQTWSQEPAGYERTAKVAVPATSAGQKIPVVLHLHGNGGQGNTAVLSRWLGDDCVIVSADGYERSWNIFAEKSKADDVSFLVDLLAKVGAEVLAADMDDVNIIGTSNGAAMTYRLIIETGADRPFRRVFPMVSSLISPQYHDGAFWASPELSADGVNNVYDTAVVPEFAANFEYAHFHGTDDGTIKYEGQVPGPNFLSGADVLAAQETDFLWAQAMGYTGSQLPDGDGVSVGTSALPVESYTYLDGKVRHFKLIDEGHGTGPGHAVVQEIVRAAILG